MKMRGVEAQGRAERSDGGGLGVHEDADGFNARRELRADFRRVGRSEMTRTFFVKVEAEKIRAGFASSAGVGPISYAADFYQNHDAATPSGARRRGVGRARRPDPLTAMQSSGMRSINSNEVSTRTSSVFRSRLLTPMTLLPTARARSSSSAV